MSVYSELKRRNVLSWSLLQLNPVFDFLHDEPRYLKILATAREQIEAASSAEAAESIWQRDLLTT